MKMSDVLNEAPKKKPVNKDSWVKKADDAVRKSFPMKAIQTMQGAIGRPGPSEKDPSKDDKKKTKTVKKKLTHKIQTNLFKAETIKLIQAIFQQ